MFNPTLGLILVIGIPAVVAWVAVYVGAKWREERDREMRMQLYRGVQYGRKDQSR